MVCTTVSCFIATMASELLDRPLEVPGGHRVAPSDLRDHRLSHQFLGPCCLCPLRSAERPRFVEAAIFVVKSGRFSGEYVAECALGECGYFGKLWIKI
jgi:hypothetical protein